VATPLEQIFISRQDHQDDGFYTIDRISFEHAGRWHLDMVLVWQTADGVSQVDHIQLSVDVAGALR
ncbi:MAG: hypothetical protein HKN70_10565, partial [Gammaproteobacteria bacterium]|nr:hypothetical protein [Gammaproteobacteria bacterium]